MTIVYFEALKQLIKKGFQVLIMLPEIGLTGQFEKKFLEEAQIDAEQIDSVVFYEKPFLKFERLLETYVAFVPKGFLSFSKESYFFISKSSFTSDAALSLICFLISLPITD